MTSPGHRILLVEDCRDDVDLLRFALDDAEMDYELHVVRGEAELREALLSFSPSILISDLSLPGFSGTAALTLAHASDPRLPLLLLTGFEELEPPPHAHLLRKSELARAPALIAELSNA